MVDNFAPGAFGPVVSIFSVLFRDAVNELRPGLVNIVYFKFTVTFNVAHGTTEQKRI